MSWHGFRGVFPLYYGEMYALKTVDETLQDLHCSPLGLNAAEVERRRAYYGWNEIPERKRSLVFLFLKQFQSVLVYILIGALVLSVILPWYEHGGRVGLGDFLDAIVIAVVLLLNALLGFFQENRSENAIALLKRMSAPTVRVRREEKVQIIPSRDIVPGDVLLLAEGDRVSADGRIMTAQNAEADEASLTGESKPVRKMPETVAPPLDASGKSVMPVLGEQTDMVFRGTVMTRGHLEVCVTATGAYTELGKIAELVMEVQHPPTPLESSMSKLGRWIGGVVLVFCVVIFLVGFERGLPLGEMLLAAASLAVSAVPEGLPAIVTVSLAIGVQRMIRQRALTRELQAIETLGSVTVICTDKTGTLTENLMKVQELWLDGQHLSLAWEDGNARATLVPDSSAPLSPHVPLLLEIGASCNTAPSLEVGDPTEIALLKIAAGLDTPRRPIKEENVPFSSERKYMVTTHEIEGEEVQYWKGAPEIVLPLCTHVLRAGKEELLTDEMRAAILLENARMARSALRILGLAMQKNASIVFVGLIGMLDAPREGVTEAIERAQSAGIRTIMITGDHVLTARAIAEKIGIGGEVLAGKELDALSDEELQRRLQTISIFARVSPAHKVRILSALQAQGEIVAMGGDGVNDAPALKKAHVGFAMGKEGTDVARETAQIVLTDDHYATIVEAIEEGRAIYDNIRKFVTFLLRANFDELAVIFIAIIWGVPLPFLPIHLLFINLVTDSLPAMALALEEPEANVMRRPPRDPKAHILRGEFGFIFLAGIIATIATFHAFSAGLALSDDVDVARTLSVSTAILFELFLVSTCRSRRSLLTVGLFGNFYLVAATLIAFSLLLLILYTPLASLFHVVPLTLVQWKLPVLWSVGALFFFEMLKVLPRPRFPWYTRHSHAQWESVPQGS